VRRALLAAVAAALLAGPTALAFFTGGYFAAGREWAGVATWVLAAAALLLVPRALRFDRSALIMLGSLAGLTVWSLVSADWAPIAGDAWSAGELVALYTGALLAAAVVFRDRSARRAAEPVLALGTAVVIGYGMSERLLPGLLHFSASITAEGRLEQPLTYWNAMGELAGSVVSFAAAAAGAAITAPFHCVTALAGPRSTAETQGAIVLGGLIVLAVIAAVVQLRVAVSAPSGDLRLPRYAAQLTCGLAVVLMGLAIVVGSTERSGEQLGGGAGRLTTLSSSRYAYWRVAIHTFDKQPIRGVGAGGWAVYWLAHQGHDGFAQDAHSLPLQTMAELGLIGLALLLALFAGAGLAAHRALVVDRAAAAAPIAVLVAWFAHSLIDWDWQMPAVSLIAFAMAGLLAAVCVDRAAAPSPDATAPIGPAPVRQ
jgi:O-antigen ligase